MPFIHHPPPTTHRSSPAHPLTRPSIHPLTGMTVVELLVAIGVFGVVMGLTVQLILVALRMSDQLAARAELQEDVSALLERVARDAAESARVEASGNRLVLFQPDRSVIAYTFLPTRQTLLRDAGKAKPCLLRTTQVQAVEFAATPPYCHVTITAARRLPRSQRYARFVLGTTVRIRR